jgi:hypothetical protein
LLKLLKQYLSQASLVRVLVSVISLGCFLAGCQKQTALIPYNDPIKVPPIAAPVPAEPEITTQEPNDPELSEETTEEGTGTKALEKQAQSTPQRMSQSQQDTPTKTGSNKSAVTTDTKAVPRQPVKQATSTPSTPSSPKPASPSKNAQPAMRPLVPAYAQGPAQQNTAPAAPQAPHSPQAPQAPH